MQFGAQHRHPVSVGVRLTRASVATGVQLLDSRPRRETQAARGVPANRVGVSCSSPSGWFGTDLDPFARPRENAEDFCRFLAGAAEPMRHLRVELGDLARPK